MIALLHEVRKKLIIQTACGDCKKGGAACEIEILSVLHLG